MGIEKKNFGITPFGEKVTAYTITNSSGMSATILDFGAILTNLQVKDQTGALLDVVLGFDDLESYLKNPAAFGATIGRNCNRISKASFLLDGVLYSLEKNEGENNLHSGTNGYHKRMFAAEIGEEENRMDFSLQSPHLDQGFPGELKLSVSYLLREDNTLSITYQGISSKDTIMNLTNHSYFNLAGHKSGSILDHNLLIHAHHYTKINPELIPTGETPLVFETPFDFTASKRIGKDIFAKFEQLNLAGGYDHNFILEAREHQQEPAAILSASSSGIQMKVFTDCPGIQLYTGNFIEKQSGKEGSSYQKHSGVCLETQFAPDAINQKGFLAPIQKAGELYSSTTCYRFEIL